MSTKENGFYIIKDKFFIDFPDPYLRGNDNENRPHYYCFKDDNLIWMIPLSKKADKYKKYISKAKERGKKDLDVFHIIKIANKESAFLIGDMFPTTDKYILREYTINNIHLVLKNQSDIRILNKKAKKILAKIKNGVKFHNKQPDVLKIMKNLSK